MSVTEKYSTSEKQLITTLSWFRSRYSLFMGLALERKAIRRSIEEFGKVWIGKMKKNWDDAFISLEQKNIIAYIDGEFRFTDYGHIVKSEIESETPFYKYEYDNYFTLEQVSKAHSVFCEKVYGIDMSQHGLIDHGELLVLIDKINTFKPTTILDIGCGNGRITEWISQQTQTTCVGIDISSEAVKLANERTKRNNKLHFIEGNLNFLKGLQQQDCILFLDTLYYANSIAGTLKQAIELLHHKGRIYAYFSQWIMDANYKENLLADNTHIAKVLQQLNVNYSYSDLTISGLHHWARKLEILHQMKKDFFDEGSKDLWKYRFREASRYANWGDDKYARYLYEIWKD